ncbi:hypothetical protein [Vibrio phage vB_VpaP_SJSY21]|nr:hypothetical protein [Vibrio phage vB_VpaP_SJSY21]
MSKIKDITIVKDGSSKSYPGYIFKRTLYTAQVKGLFGWKEVAYIYTEIHYDNGEREFYWDLLDGGRVPEKLIRATQWNTTLLDGE